MCRTKYKKISVVYKSKYNNKCKKQVILLMIGDGKKTSEKRRKRLVSEPNYYSCKNFSDHLMAIEMKKKTRVKMN